MHCRPGLSLAPLDCLQFVSDWAELSPSLFCRNCCSAAPPCIHDPLCSHSDICALLLAFLLIQVLIFTSSSSPWYFPAPLSLVASWVSNPNSIIFFWCLSSISSAWRPSEVVPNVFSLHLQLFFVLTISWSLYPFLWISCEVLSLNCASVMSLENHSLMHLCMLLSRFLELLTMPNSLVLRFAADICDLLSSLLLGWLLAIFMPLYDNSFDMFRSASISLFWQIFLAIALIVSREEWSSRLTITFIFHFIRCKSAGLQCSVIYWCEWPDDYRHICVVHSTCCVPACLLRPAIEWLSVLRAGHEFFCAESSSSLPHKWDWLQMMSHLAWCICLQGARLLSFVVESYAYTILDVVSKVSFAVSHAPLTCVHYSGRRLQSLFCGELCTSDVLFPFCLFCCANLLKYFHADFQVFLMW